MKKCLHCQHTNPDQSNFCNNCGSKLSILPSSDSGNVVTSKKQAKGKRPAERRQLTILFCDLIGSTSLSEKMDPEDYRQMILDYQQVAEDVISGYGGHVGNYLGDGLLVYFGYPEGLEDAAKVAVRAGLGIIEAVAQANIGWEAIGKTKIDIRIGIHTGLVIVDDHLALGETVNIAARLEGLAPHNGIVISPQTLNLIRGWFDVKSTGKHTLKGISEPLEVFIVLNESGAKSRLDIAKNKGLSPLVGRDEELKLLSKCWTLAKNSKGNLVLLHGEAGIGKSRLIDAIQNVIEKESSKLLLEVRCSSYQQNSAFNPIIELIEKDLLQFEVDEDAKGKLIKLEKYVNKSCKDNKTAIPIMVEFLSISSESFPPLVMSPFAKRQKIFDLLTEIIIYQAVDQPLAFIIEDLHWADASTLEWLRSLLDQLHEQPIYLLATTRPEYQPEWNKHDVVRQIRLERLSVKNIQQICHHQARGKKLPEEIIQQITDKTEGVPLFVEELTKMIMESDLLVEKDDNFEIAGSLDAISIPSTLQDSLLARLDRLSDVKEIVQIGSVLGREFSVSILSAVLKQKMEDHLEKSLNKLLESEIFQHNEHNQELGYQFKHSLIQDTAYDSMLKSHRQHLHHKVANVLEQEFPETIQTQPELLAHHYTEAALPLSAIPIWLQAGKQASKKNATTEAIAHLEKGISLLPHIKNVSIRNNLELDFQLTLGGTFVVSHGFPHPKVKETFNRARDITKNIEANPKVALVMFNLLSYYMNTEDYEAHSELADYMIKLSENPENGYWFELFACQLVGGARVVLGDFKVANRSYQRALEIFDPSLPFPWELAPSGYLEIGTKAWQMICLQILGYMDQAKDLSDRHLDFAKNHHDSMTLYHIYTFPALLNLQARNWKLAEKIIEEYLPIVREFGDPVFILTSDLYFNIAKAFQQDKTAFVTAVNLINVCFDIGFKAFAVSMSAFIAELFFHFGQHEKAIIWIEKILKHVNVTGSRISNSELFRIKGIALQALRRPDIEAEECFKKALEISRNQSAKTFELRASANLSKLYQNQGKTIAAYTLLKSTYDWFEEGHDSADLTEARELLAELAD